jgi:hypothetical protein
MSQRILERLLTGGSMMSEVQRRVDIVVSLWIDRDVDVEEVLQEMDYEFSHPAIKDTEIVKVVDEV